VWATGQPFCSYDFAIDVQIKTIDIIFASDYIYNSDYGKHRHCD